MVIEMIIIKMNFRKMAIEDYFHYLAIGTTIFSSMTIVVLLFAIPTIYLKAERERLYAVTKSASFKEKSDRIWTEMKSAREKFGVAVILRRRRSQPNIFKDRNQMVCSECIQLGCPAGPPGLSGPPGEDGIPGMAGNPGLAGDDGYDIQLALEDELPCVICPAGPPGQRGLQGERGQPGERGKVGKPGPPGVPGENGPIGEFGPSGSPGLKGPIGLPGPSGETVIAGTGIKGQKGPVGPPGPKGPIGLRGKPAKESGFAGKSGSIGPVGPPGRYGKKGEEGPWGPPGEPGQPAAYCPSDCGVSQIFTSPLTKRFLSVIKE
ncbi:collagen triple helix repeat protein [Onchocerca flexuosa]|uniref:Collagen triple helix repeat protein n=1 Tax=Onchocerca flexuosa TaxID=387005 RepID=A0A238BUG3_9BILA|nr:collagen triple helix repeat protein [Onchocerca flexuosa]